MRTSKTDHLLLEPPAASFTPAKEETTEMRADRLQRIAQGVRTGTYRVSAAQLAEKLMTDMATE